MDAYGADDESMREVFTNVCLAKTSQARAKELDEQAGRRLGH